MLKVDIQINDNFTKALDKMSKELYNYPWDAKGEFQSLTPIRSGNARNHTRLSADRSHVLADYPYAQRLDEGWSKQAPSGMTKPFEQWVEKKMKKIFGK